MFVIKNKKTGNLYTGNGWSDKKDEAKGFDSQEVCEALVKQHRMDADISKVAGDSKDFPGITTGSHE